MMQDAFLRVFVVALGLLVCPRDDPGSDERDDIVTVGTQQLEERQPRDEVKLEEETAPVREKMTHRDDKGPRNIPKSIPKEQTQSDEDVTDKHNLSVPGDMAVLNQDSSEHFADLTGGHFISYSDSSQPQQSRSEPEVSPKTSQTDHEQKGNQQFDMGSKQHVVLTGGSFRDPVPPQGQQEKPEEMEVEASLSEVHTTMSENGSSEEAIGDWEEDYLWYIWNTFSLISIIRFFRKYLRKNSPIKPDESRTFPVTRIAAEVPLPDGDTLHSFHSQCVQASSNNKWREDEFLEGFANHMVEAMRIICDSNGGMAIDNCQMLDACDMIVPITPTEPYSFQFLLWNNQASDLLLDMQVCGQIKLVANKKTPNGCHCQSSDTDDMVCLLHCEDVSARTKMTESRLCMKNTSFLSKSQVSRWFQCTIKQAWAQISHKYDFELSIRYIDAPGTLVVRFRSGKQISFSMNPVVKLNADAHFYITPCAPNNLDTCWPLSLTVYEEHLLECLVKRLPENPCHIRTLDIACFLHKRQTALSGSSALKDLHFKTALIHLLLTKDPSQWKPQHVADRLRDLLDFLEKSLERKLLHHVFIGNTITQKFMLLPVEFTQAKPVNLFHPLVEHECIYRNAVMHFQEVLRNAHILIKDYISAF
ncbi:inositol 1,4,5-trisphosphate receptor-interacting protein [Scophthalmus maximus]|nr:inositol 1,4,5-trisphosphate receptor-interacting protein [Scophthalmus maximus]XP_035493868.1 inositol 1,4,5-trisphosphate receptor-interacting protein [Scophthalmus maximus]